MENMHEWIQIAGVRDWDEAQMLTRAGTHHLGFPLYLDVHKEDLSVEAAAAIIRRLAPPVQAVLITYLAQAQEVLALCQYLQVSIVQLHAAVPADELATLKACAPDLYVIKSLIVKEDNEAELEKQVAQFTPYVDAFITDTYDAATGATGATGKTHNWEISRRIVEISPRPVLLAGGLRPENVQSAILQVQPAGVDVHTGVERPDGRKDEYLVQQFISQAIAAFEAIAKR